MSENHVHILQDIQGFLHYKLKVRNNSIRNRRNQLHNVTVGLFGRLHIILNFTFGGGGQEVVLSWYSQFQGPIYLVKQRKQRRETTISSYEDVAHN